MRRFFAVMMVILLFCGLCACAAQKPGSDVPSDKEAASTAVESGTQMQEETEPTETRTEAQPAETQVEPQPAETQAEPQPAETQTEPQPAETQTEPQPQNEPERKTVRLTLPFMETEDYVSFMPEDGAESGGLSLQIPADWTEDAGLFYCPEDGGVRKVLEPVCLLREMDDEQWDKLAQFDIAEDYGDIEYLSVASGTDANGRDYIQLMAKSWPEGGTISVWYPCFCFLRGTSGTTAVLTYYQLDSEDQTAKAELREILDSIRLE